VRRTVGEGTTMTMRTFVFINEKDSNQESLLQFNYRSTKSSVIYSATLCYVAQLHLKIVPLLLLIFQHKKSKTNVLGLDYATRFVG
jgi:hypothetical protein